VASPGRRDATGVTHGAGLTVVETPRVATQKECAISQELGEWLIWGIAAEGLAWPVIGDPLWFTLANMAGLGALILGQLAHRERAKRSRIAARTERKIAWAGALTTTR
jgi:hypothetical protein